MKRDYSDPLLKRFCDLIALIYHESRNVRHLVRQNLTEREKWILLMSLPTNRDDAWREIVALRDKAQFQTVEEVLELFETRFLVSLAEVAEMLANKNWRHAKLYGGNAWAEIARLAIDFARAIEDGERRIAEELIGELENAQHNTGSLREKLSRLEMNRRSRG